MSRGKYSGLRYPLFDAAKTSTLLKVQQESTGPSNGCLEKVVPLFRWSWPRNGRRPGWKRPLVRLPSIPVTTAKAESVNVRRSEPFWECDLKASSLRTEAPPKNPFYARSPRTRLEIKPETRNNLKDSEIKDGLPEIKRRQLVVIIPYNQCDSNTDESDESVDGDEAFDSGSVNEKHQNIPLKYSCHENTDKKERLFKDDISGKTTYNKQSKKLPLQSKSNLPTESRKSAQRMRVLMRKTMSATETSEQGYLTPGHSSDNEDETKEKAIVDFSHKVRVQWQKELRDILNKSPDYKRCGDVARTNEKTDLRSCKMATALPSVISDDIFFCLQNNHRKKSDDKLTELVKENVNHLQRLVAGYNLALTCQMQQETGKLDSKKQNLTTCLERRTKKRTRESRKVCGLRDNRQSNSFDFHFFGNLLEASKSQPSVGIKHRLNDSKKNSYTLNSKYWVINSPVYKKKNYKKKLK